MPCRILFALLDFPPVPGGMSRYYAQLLEHLPPEEVVLLTLHHPERPEVPYPVETVSLQRRGAFSLARYPTWLQAFRRAVWRYRPAGLLLGHLGFAKMPGIGRLGPPYGLFVHGLDVLHEHRKARRNPWKHYRLRAAFARAHLVIANSQATLDLVRQLGLPVRQGAVVYPGVDPEVFRPLNRPRAELRRSFGLPEEAFLVLFVGRPVARKGLRVLLEALQRLPDAVQAVVAGPGDFEEAREQARHLGVAHRVRFLGAVSDADLVALYNAVDVFALPGDPRPHDVEGFGIVFLEANACGIPVIGGRWGGVPEAIAHEESGLLVEPGNPEALAEAVLRLYRNSERRQQMGRAGRTRVLRHFTWAHQAQALRRAYHASFCPETGPRT